MLPSSRSAAKLLLLSGVATEVCELHRDWRNDGLGTLFSNHLAD